MEAEARLGVEPGAFAFRALAKVVALFPYRWLRALGAVLGAIAGSVLRIRRSHVVASIDRAGIDNADGSASRMYRSLGAGLLELLWMSGRAPAAVDDHFTVEPRAASAIAAALEAGRGAIFATAHTGNWDLVACAAARWLAWQNAGPLHVVTKRLSWRALDRYWQRLRAERGVVLHDADGAVAEVREALARGECVALLVDQRPERASGIASLPFLGADCDHDLGPAILAARARSPILALYGHRGADGEHRVELCDAIDASELRGGKPAHVAATARIAMALERFVRAHPDQWLWLHKRWKRREA